MSGVLVQNYSCPQVVYMWRLQQLMKRCAHTLRVQLMDYEGVYIVVTIGVAHAIECDSTGLRFSSSAGAPGEDYP